MNRALAVLATATFLVAATATPANAASAKSRLVGPDARVTCANVAEEAWDGENINDLGPGTVSMKTKSGKVSTKVELRGAEPRTTYVVSLIQGEADCHTVDKTVRTDRRGNGTLTHTERKTGVAAQTVVHTGSQYGEPRWRAQQAVIY